MSVEVGTAYVSIVPSAKGFAGKLQSELGGGLSSAGTEGGKRYGSGMFAAAKGLVAPVAGLFALEGLKNFASFGIGVASANEQAKISFTTMLGSAQKADAFLQQMKTFAASTPFEFPELQTAASSLISAGVNAKDVIPIMRTLGDVTSGMGTGAEGVQRATIALQQMNAAGKISGEDLNQLRDAGIPVYDLLSKATGKSTAEVVKLAQSGKLGKKELSQMMAALESGRGLERFSGLMDKQSQSLAGLASTFKDNLGQGLATALEPVIPLLKDGLGVASTAVAKAMSGLAGGLRLVIAGAQAMGPFLQQVSDAFDVFFTALGNGEVTTQGFLGQVGNIAYALRDAFLETLPRVETFLRQVWGVIQTQVVPAIKAFGGYLIANVVPILMTVGRIIVTQVVPAIIALATFIYTRVYPAVLAIVVAIASRLKPILDALFSVIASRVVPVIQLIAAKFREWWPTIQKVITVVIAIIGWVLKLAASILGKVLPVIIQLAGFLLTVVVKAIIGVIEGVARFIGALIRFGVAVYNAGRNVVDFARTVADKIREVITFFVTLPSRIVGALGDVKDTLLDAGRNIIDGLLRGITEKFDMVKKKLGELTKMLPDWKGPASLDRTILRESGRLVIGGFINGMESQYGTVQDSLSGLTRALPTVPFSTVAAGSAGGLSGGVGGTTRLHPHDIALLADAIAARPTVLDGRRVSQSQDRALVVGVMA